MARMYVAPTVRSLTDAPPRPGRRFHFAALAMAVALFGACSSGGETPPGPAGRRARVRAVAPALPVRPVSRAPPALRARPASRAPAAWQARPASRAPAASPARPASRAPPGSRARPASRAAPAVRQAAPAPRATAGGSGTGTAGSAGGAGGTSRARPEARPTGVNVKLDATHQTIQGFGINTALMPSGRPSRWTSSSPPRQPTRLACPSFASA